MASGQPGNGHGNLEESTALASLRELVAAGNQRLDPILASLADAARELTGASGAALAMWKEGAMVCRARSGETAPALGARLSAETGISGACLRTGRIQHCADTEKDPLVDAEVCRSLGLRSIAVLPIQGWRGVNGILEVFSTKPGAFSEEQVALLHQLAALAERARASQPHGASPSAPKLPSAMAKPEPSGLLPASDRVGDVALAFVGRRSRPLVLGALSVVAISLLGLAIWLGWRGPDEAEGKAHAAAPVNEAGITTVTARALDKYSAEKRAVDNHQVDHHPVDHHPVDNDPVWKPNPGGESLVPLSGKPSAGSPVKFAAKVDVVAGKKTQAAGRAPLLSDLADKVAGDGVVRHEAAAQMGAPAPVSAVVSGGQLLHRVPPVYPAEARLLRIEGKVILAATVMEDGTVRDVKVVEGPPALTESAMDAVKRWRYKPFELDGKPVKNEIGISVDFKFPETVNP